MYGGERGLWDRKHVHISRTDWSCVLREHRNTGGKEEKASFSSRFSPLAFFEWLTSGVHLIGPTQNKIRTPNSSASHTHTHPSKPMGHRKPNQKGPKTVMENVQNASTAEATTPTTMGILTHRGRKPAGPTGRESGPLYASGEKFEPDAKIRKLNTTRTHTHGMKNVSIFCVCWGRNVVFYFFRFASSIICWNILPVESQLVANVQRLVETMSFMSEIRFITIIFLKTISFMLFACIWQSRSMKLPLKGTNRNCKDCNKNVSLNTLYTFNIPKSVQSSIWSCTTHAVAVPSAVQFQERRKQISSTLSNINRLTHSNTTPVTAPCSILRRE